MPLHHLPPHHYSDIPFFHSRRRALADPDAERDRHLPVGLASWAACAADFSLLRPDTGRCRVPEPAGGTDSAANAVRVAMYYNSCHASCQSIDCVWVVAVMDNDSGVIGQAGVDADGADEGEARPRGHPADNRQQVCRR